jgi:hypothetical protein
LIDAKEFYSREKEMKRERGCSQKHSIFSLSSTLE